MGFLGLFNNNANAKDLSAAEMVVPLAADPETGLTHVYLGRSVASGEDGPQVDGEIVTIETEDLEAYTGNNILQPYMISPEGATDFANHRITEALVTIELEGTGDMVDIFDTMRDVFSTPDDVAPIATLAAMGVHLNDGPSETAVQIEAALEEATRLAEEKAQAANHGEIPEDAMIDGYSNEEMTAILQNWANAANETVDGLHLAQNIYVYRQDLMADLKENPDLGFDAVEVLLDEIENGPAEGGPQHYDDLGIDPNATPVMMPSQ